ncbi:hypothetical protein QVD17_22581 [Tagetes erecta]|uniref:Uncharacterized protein n=1 Tax=Tagetes erecta TaxID=13708 RepID=A0AAD8KG79_TARER|nr:hypothetical protein QVD17_22581 [Tagetes erecta]
MKLRVSKCNMKGVFVCCLLILVFMFSATTDASRNSGWIMKKEEVAVVLPQPQPQIHIQDEIYTTSDEENTRYVESTPRRLDLEDMDYGGTGANDRHDPKSPGRA